MRHVPITVTVQLYTELATREEKYTQMSAMGASLATLSIWTGLKGYTPLFNWV